MQYYISTINLPGMLTNMDCHRASIIAALHMFGELALMLAQHHPEGTLN